MTKELKNERERQIRVMQKNLRGLREMAGYTTEELGEKIDVTAQSIRNWESQRGKMQFFTYIALRRVFEVIAEKDNNRVLFAAMDKIFTSTEDEDVLMANIVAIGVLMNNSSNKDMVEKLITSVLGEIPEKVEWEDVPSWLKELL